ncbi:MAG: hypothetical protein KOO66_09155 [Bacteroidales bacterium]|nr:hypothetical protein [Bacteroidales bacterium]
MNKGPKILICPLNWGLGHATRLVPLIKLLIRNDFDIRIAASGDSLVFLKKEFQKLKFIDFPNYEVRYSRSNSQVFRLLMAIPKIIFYSLKEHWQVKKIIKKKNIDIIISDNRYGLWCKNAYSIFITHQLNAKFPGFLRVFEPGFRMITGLIIKKYDECWIPDCYGDDSLAGELSQLNKKVQRIYYTGIFSRFKNSKERETSEKELDILFILSGPEPQRSVFETTIYNQAVKTQHKIVLVRGTTTINKKHFSFPVYDLLESEKLLSLINKSEIIVCRSGYSSIMDLIALNKKAILVPTPGQTEQEYLAQYLQHKGFFYSVKQSEFNLESAIENIYNAPETDCNSGKDKLRERIMFLKDKQNYR